uniref:Ig-like domain-containing protein n=1 Tax=Astyanax mexicanus TaxID=7994 RepID=A0A3B1J7Q8_ASTMX
RHSPIHLLLVQINSNTISPVESEKQVSAGNRVTLSCSYTGSNVYSIQWYRQYPSSKLVFLLYITPSGSMSDNRPAGFSAKVQSNIVNLEISSTAVSDSALYYCALEPTVNNNPAPLCCKLLHFYMLAHNVLQHFRCFVTAALLYFRWSNFQHNQSSGI